MTGCIDDLYGFKRVESPRLPQDMSMHRPELAMRAMKFVLGLYPEFVRVRTNVVTPGDWVVIAWEGGGPGHGLCGGAQPNTLWECLKPGGVQYTGVKIMDARLVAIYSPTNKQAWLNRSHTL